MTATERLRALLDERGVEWVPYSAFSTLYTMPDGKPVRADGDFMEGRVELYVRNLTPEQAIDATLGAQDKVYAVGGIIAQAECRDVCASIAEFTCSACGFNCDLTSWISLFDGDDGRHRHHHYGTPNYCPNCGRKVVDA